MRRGTSPQKGRSQDVLSADQRGRIFLIGCGKRKVNRCLHRHGASVALLGKEQHKSLKLWIALRINDIEIYHGDRKSKKLTGIL